MAFIRTQLRQDNYQDQSVQGIKFQDGVYDLRNKYFDYLPPFLKNSGICADYEFPQSLGFVLGLDVRTMLVGGGRAVLNGQIRQFSSTTLTLLASGSSKVFYIYADFSDFTIKATEGEFTTTYTNAPSGDDKLILGYIESNNPTDDLLTCTVVEYRNMYSASNRVATLSGTIDTDSSLPVRLPLPSYNINTSLNGDIDAAQNTITVLSTDGFPGFGYIRINGEIISYASKDKTHFYTCNRAEQYSDAATHNHKTTIDYVAPWSDCNHSVSINYIDGYPVWEYSRWKCSVDSTRVIECYAWAPTWGVTYTKGIANYFIIARERL